MVHKNIVKIQRKMNQQNLLKIWLQVIYHTDFCIVCIHFTMGKSENVWFKKQNKKKKKKKKKKEKNND